MVISIHQQGNEARLTGDVKMKNSIEHIVVDESDYWFDHSTGIATASHKNGYNETWNAPKLGYSIEQAYIGFLLLTDQWDRYIQIQYGN